MEFTAQQESRIRLYFRTSVFLKGAISLIEIIAGVLVLFVPLSNLTTFAAGWAQGELIEQPGDFVATHLLAAAQQFSIANSIFIAVYLLSRGCIKLALVAALLKNQLWAYPASLAVLGLFVIYQLYQITLSYSLVLIGLTAFDLIVMWFIWREYEVVKSASPA
ncbi:MAG TPA: DUF2127 domain-containing protein [Candidatus Paceibacterota bacterium]|nr:DUF2127 domain-containing protein [Candidatus Paceibacterota bacterium]